MTDLLPPDLPFSPAPRRERRIIWTALLSALAHLAIFALLFLLPLLRFAEPAPPEAIAVDIVTPSQLASLDSSEPPSSEEPSSSQPPSSEAPSSSGPPDSSEAPSASSAAASSAAASSGEPSAASEPASSASASSAEASSEPDASATSAETAASQAASAVPSEAPPKPMPAPPLVIPVGPAASSEASAEPDDASAEQDVAGKPADGAPPKSTAPKFNSPLHVASEFYASTLLQAPQMEATRKAIEALPKPRRIAQLCNLEALGQIARTMPQLQPNALIADAFTATTTSGLGISAPGGAFRSGETWYGVAFKCTVAADLSAVTAFSFRVSPALPGPPQRALPARPAGQ